MALIWLTLKSTDTRSINKNFSVKTDFEELKKKVNKLDGWYFGLLVSIYWKPKDENMRWMGHLCIKRDRSHKYNTTSNLVVLNCNNHTHSYIHTWEKVCWIYYSHQCTSLSIFLTFEDLKKKLFYRLISHNGLQGPSLPVPNCMKEIFLWLK